MSDKHGQEAALTEMPQQPLNACSTNEQRATSSAVPITESNTSYGYTTVSCHIIAVLLMISILFTETTYYQLRKVTAASGLVFICHAVLVYYSPPGKGLGSLITCFVAGPWFFWCLMTFLWWGC